MRRSQILSAVLVTLSLATSVWIVAELTKDNSEQVGAGLPFVDGETDSSSDESDGAPLGDPSESTTSTGPASPAPANPTPGNPSPTSPGTPTTLAPTTTGPAPTTPNGPTAPTSGPTTTNPSTSPPTTAAPTTGAPTTAAPTTAAPTTGAPTTAAPTTGAPTTAAPATAPPTTAAPTPAAPGNLRIGIVGMTSLANYGVEGSRRLSYRVEATQTSNVESLRLYFIDNATRTGYASGTGGKIRVQIAPDDGTGKPDEARMFPGKFDAEFGLTNGRYEGPDRRGFVRNKLLGLWTFDQPIPLVAGQTYHIVFKNIDPNPAANYIGIDLVIDMVKIGSGDPCIQSPARPANLAFLRNMSGNSWEDFTCDNRGYTWTPIYEFRYANGAVQGQGVMQWDVVAQYRISGNAAVRTTIRLPKDQTVSELAARVERHATGSVSLQLETLDGEVLRSVTAATNGLGNYRNAVWAEGSVAPITLKANTDYALVVRPLNGYSGSIVPVQAGLNYGFHPSSNMPFGVAQTSSNGTSWTAWSGGGVRYFPFAVN